MAADLTDIHYILFRMSAGVCKCNYLCIGPVEPEHGAGVLGENRAGAGLAPVGHSVSSQHPSVPQGDSMAHYV